MQLPTSHLSRFCGAIRSTRNRLLVVATAVLIVPAAGGGLLAAADEPAADDATDFEPGDISIGEPIALPFSERVPQAASAAAPASAEPSPMPRSPRFAPQPVRPLPEPESVAGDRADEATTEQPLPGSGWLGFAVIESDVAGRWEVDTVAVGGPAAAAGIRSGDEIRAIDGLPLKSSDDVSQAMTAVAPGQDVRLAIARGEQVADLTITAAARPRGASAWGAAAALADRDGPVTMAESPRSASVPAAPAAALAAVPAPPPGVAAPAAVELPPPAVAAPARPAAPPGRPAVRAGPAAGSLVPPAPFSRPPTASRSPETGPASAGSADRGRTALGVRTLPVDEAIQSRFNLPEPRGAYVIGVVSDLPAARAGVPPGSIIVSLDDSPVASPAELTRLVTSGPVGRPVPLEYVLPGGGAQRAEVVLQTLERPLEEALVGRPGPAPTAIPTLEQQPRPTTPTTTRRPVTSFDAGAVSAMQDEIRWLRSRLDRLEQRLDGQAR